VNILITGSDGFIGKNLKLYFLEKKDVNLFLANRKTSQIELKHFILSADHIIHLAGVNRPVLESEFLEGNANTTKEIVDILVEHKKTTPIYYSSSIQAELDNPYGKSKFEAEKSLSYYNSKTGAPVIIYRFTNVFGKFAKPNYNSVVATFCFNIARSIPIEIHHPEKILKILFIDDICKDIEFALKLPNEGKLEFRKVEPIYEITIGELADTLNNFKNIRNSLLIPPVGQSLMRALYSTYISYLPIEDCEYEINQYQDPRGRFVEMLKTESSGQFSYFVAPAGVTRGRHYHNTKTEKFLIIQGKALFRFQNRLTNEYYEIRVEGSSPKIVDTIPGWTHDITNIGEEELIVMLWANEVFNRDEPDTFYAEIEK